MIVQLLMIFGCIAYLICSYMMDDFCSKSTEDTIFYNRYHTGFVMGDIVVACIGLIMVMSLIVEYLYAQT